MLEKTESYSHDLKSRKIFAKLNEDMLNLGQQLEQSLAGIQGMRLTLGTCVLAVSEIEHRFVSQSQAKRKTDSLLFEATTRLADFTSKMTINAASMAAQLNATKPKLDAMHEQTLRTLNDRGIIDDEKDGTVEGVEYVDINFFCDQLGNNYALSKKIVRMYIEQGKLPAHDASSPNAEGGRPSYKWVKSKAVLAVAEFKEKYATRAYNKKGVAALV